MDLSIKLQKVVRRTHNMSKFGCAVEARGTKGGLTIAPAKCSGLDFDKGLGVRVRDYVAIGFRIDLGLVLGLGTVFGSGLKLREFD